MKYKIIFSALFVFLFAAVSYGQQGQANRLRFSHIPDSSGGHLVNVTFPGVENPNLRIFESIIPASSAAECHSSTAFPNPRVLGPDEARLGFDRATSTVKFDWLVHIDRQLLCRVVRVGESVDAADLALWQSNYGVGGLIDYSDESNRRNVGDTITFTITLTNNGPDLLGKE